MKKAPSELQQDDYAAIHTEVVALLDAARRAAARSVNALMTASYRAVRRRIVEFEQGGKRRAERGEQLLQRLSTDLLGRFGRGFSVDNLELMRLFYLAYPPQRISETLSRNIALEQIAQALPLSWSHYVHAVRRTASAQERDFYEAEALRGGWTVRQLSRPIGAQFHTRALLSKNKRAMLEKGSKPQPGDLMTADEAVKDPFVLEFLDLKDEYSEADLEDALIHRLEDFLLELGGDFCFVGRQRRLRLDESWFRVDLL